MQNLLRGYRFLALPIRVAPVYGTILYYTRAYVAQAKSGKKQALCTSPGGGVQGATRLARESSAEQPYMDPQLAEMGATYEILSG